MSVSDVFFRVELLHWTSLKHWKSQPRPSQEGEKDNPLVSCCSTCYACADSQDLDGVGWICWWSWWSMIMTRAGENPCSTKPTQYCDEDRNSTFNCSTHKRLARNATIDDWWQAEIPDSQVIPGVVSSHLRQRTWGTHRRCWGEWRNNQHRTALRSHLLGSCWRVAGKVEVAGMFLVI